MTSRICTHSMSVSPNQMTEIIAVFKQEDVVCIWNDSRGQSEEFKDIRKKLQRGKHARNKTTIDRKEMAVGKKMTAWISFIHEGSSTRRLVDHVVRMETLIMKDAHATSWSSRLPFLVSTAATTSFCERSSERRPLVSASARRWEVGRVSS